MHFGLGNTERVDAIEGRWSDGTVKRLDSPQLNQYHTVLTRVEWEAFRAKRLRTDLTSALG